MVQTLGVLEATDFVPSLSIVLSCAVKPPPELQVGLEGRLEMDGVGAGVAFPIRIFCALPEPAVKFVLAVCAVRCTCRPSHR